jgi:isopenicillin-N epimerase
LVDQNKGRDQTVTHTPLKEFFLLDPEIHFLNHGSFGACPKPVFEAYQEWQRQLERQPVLFLGRELAGYERQARQSLGEYLHADADDLVYVPNATHGVNIVARSLSLGPGDEILTTNHEYGACDNTWEYLCEKRGARYIHQELPTPLTADEEIVAQLWQGVTSRTRLIFISHITSPTAMILPVRAICRRARQEGILTLIDGAHAPGQIPVNLSTIGADFYTGNCHKWMLSPKGAAFLYARREAQSLIEPLVVSWGYSADENTTCGSRYIDLLQWTGTKDPAATLSVPHAIRFMQAHNWPEVAAECHELAVETRRRLNTLTGLDALCGEQAFHQMFSVRLPDHVDLTWLKRRLYDKYRVEAPTIMWNGMKLIRISIQAYNNGSDADALIDGLHSLLDQ